MVGIELVVFSLFSSKGIGLSSGKGDGGLFIMISLVYQSPNKTQNYHQIRSSMRLCKILRVISPITGSGASPSMELSTSLLPASPLPPLPECRGGGEAVH